MSEAGLKFLKKSTLIEAISKQKKNIMIAHTDSETGKNKRFFYAQRIHIFYIYNILFYFFKIQLAFFSSVSNFKYSSDTKYVSFNLFKPIYLLTIFLAVIFAEFLTLNDLMSFSTGTDIF